MIEVVTLLQAFFISLGVGASTLAVINFFVAIWDGKIDPNERRMMGVVYTILRIEMLLLLAFTTIFSVLTYFEYVPITDWLIMQWVLLVILFVNAYLMTYLKLPSAFGPAIQVSAWYTLGVLSLMRLNQWTPTVMQSVVFYFTLCLIAVVIINTLIIYTEHRRKPEKNT